MLFVLSMFPAIPDNDYKNLPKKREYIYIIIKQPTLYISRNDASNGTPTTTPIHRLGYGILQGQQGKRRRSRESTNKRQNLQQVCACVCMECIRVSFVEFYCNSLGNFSCTNEFLKYFLLFSIISLSERAEAAPAQLRCALDREDKVRGGVYRLRLPKAVGQNEMVVVWMRI
jgi:hypothetical protein